MTIGIYILRFVGTTEVYIGQSNNIERRFTSHLLDMKKNTSTSKLQYAYTKYGKPYLDILIECSVPELDSCEKEAIQIFNSITNGFNTQLGGGDWPILYGENNPTSIHTNEDIELLFLYMCDSLESLKHISELSGVHISTIKNIANGHGYIWLKSKYPAQYAKLEARKGTRPINSLKYSGKICPTIISPEGIEYVVEHISNFAKMHNLNAGALGEVLRGNTNHHKQWKLKK